MKRVLSVLLTVLLVVGLTVPVWADEPAEPLSVSMEETDPPSADGAESFPSSDAVTISSEGSLSEQGATDNVLQGADQTDSSEDTTELENAEEDFPSETGPVVEAQNTGNEDYTGATPMQVNTIYTGSTLKYTDIDWYKVTLPSRGHISIHFENNFRDTTHTAWRIELYRGTTEGHSDRWCYWDINPYSTSRDLKPLIGVEAGIYYICVDPWNASAVEGLAYKVQVNYTATTNWEMEQNGNYTISNNVPLNSRMYGSGYTSSDEDWYRFTLPADGTVNINFSNDYKNSSSTAFSLKLYRAVTGGHGSALYEKSIVPSTTSRNLGNIYLTAGNYYMLIDTYSGGVGLNYNFMVQYTEPPPSTVNPPTTPSQPVLEGWVQRGNFWFYQWSDGSLATGWLSDAGSWYYLDSYGAMVTGWRNIGGNWYYLNPDGSMATGWKNIGGSWYYLRGTGEMSTGWLNAGGAWYLLSGTGAMVTGWVYTSGAWYYLSGSGSMVTGYQTIDGRLNYFYNTGIWWGYV